MSRLDELIDATRDAVARRKQSVPLSELVSQHGTRAGARPFKEALVRPGLSLIAEFKRRSPSVGEIRPGAEVGEIVSAYEHGGASALSVLTEERGFGGSLEDLRAAREASRLPILRKDFVVDIYQLHEAAVYGADAILLIAAALDDEELIELYAESRQLDLDAVIEVHDEDDLERALEIDPEVIGINNRDLRDFKVDTATTGELMTDVPAGITIVAESGFSTRDQLEELDRIGVDAVLIGEALMRADDPGEATRELGIAGLGDGREPELD